jgi:hypothetical protein
MAWAEDGDTDNSNNSEQLTTTTEEVITPDNASSETPDEAQQEDAVQQEDTIQQAEAEDTQEDSNDGIIAVDVDDNDELPAAKDSVIELTEDVNLSAKGWTIAAGETFTLDLKGQTLTLSNIKTGNIKVLGNLTLKDSKGNGKITTNSDYDSTHNAGVIAVSGGTFTMESGTIDTVRDTAVDKGQFAVTVGQNGTVNIKGGTIKAGWYTVAGNGTDTTDNTINITGGNLISTTDYSLYLPQGGTTKISGGVIDGGAGAISMNRGKLNITGGKFYNRGTGDTGNWSDGTGGQSKYAVNVLAKYGDCQVDISGGEFYSPAVNPTLNTGSANAIDLKVSGGHFSDNSASSYLTEGYKFVSFDSNETYDVCSEEKNSDSVATLNGKYFNSIQNAVNAAGSAQSKIQLVADSAKAFTVSEDKDIVLDLNAKTVNVDDSIDVLGKLTITDTSEKASGKIISSLSEVTPICVYGESAKVTLNKGNIESEKYYGIYAFNDAGAVVNGGTISSKYSPLGGNNTTGNMKFEVNGGTLTADEGPAIYMPGQVSLKITGGVLNGGVSLRMGQIKISGGTINATTSNNIDMPNDNTYGYSYSGNTFFPDALFVLNGTYTSNDKTYGNSLNIDITGGTFNCKNGRGSAVAIYDIGKVAQESKINITGGTFNTSTEERSAYQVLSLSDIGVSNPKDGYGKIENTGKVKSSISGGTFSSVVANDYLVTGYSCDKVNMSDDQYRVFSSNQVSDSVAQINGDSAKYFNSLFNAVDAAAAGDTITLLKDTEGSGIALFANAANGTKVKNLTIDFGGNTYTCVGPAVGSKGTQTQAFHLEKECDVTLKNGTLKLANATNVKMGIQNYCNLTLEDFNVDASEDSYCSYAMSNNHGTVNITGNSSITAYEGQRAFDVYYWPNNGYTDGVTVTVNTSGTITGTVEYGSDKTTAGKTGVADKAKLNIIKGTFNGTISAYGLDTENKTGISITGGTFSSDVFSYLAEGYLCTKQTIGSNYMVGLKPDAIKKADNVKITSSGNESVSSDDETVIENKVADIIKSAENNKVISNFTATNLQNVITDNTVDTSNVTLKIEVSNVDASVDDGSATLNSLSFNVKPVVKNGMDSSEEISNDNINGLVNFLLPVEASLVSESSAGYSCVDIAHEDDNGNIVDKKTYKVFDDGNGNKYTEITTPSFSRFTETRPVGDLVAYVETNSNVTYYTVADLQSGVTDALNSNVDLVLLADVPDTTTAVTVGEGKTLNIDTRKRKWNALNEVYDIDISEGYYIWGVSISDAGTVNDKYATEITVTADIDKTNSDIRSQVDVDGVNVNKVYVNDTVAVKLNVSSEFYGADISLLYDTNKLTLSNVNSLGNEWNVDSSTGTVHYIRNDATAKISSESLPVLKFKALANTEGSETTSVSITFARISDTLDTAGSSATKYEASKVNSAKVVIGAPVYKTYIAAASSTSDEEVEVDENTDTDYTNGVAVVYVFTNENTTFQYNGESMYNISALGYALKEKSDGEEVVGITSSGTAGDSSISVVPYSNVYAYFIKTDEGFSKDSLSNNIDHAGTTTIQDNKNVTAPYIYITEKGAMDVNGSTSIEVDDDVVISDIINITKNNRLSVYTTTSAAKFFRADVNRDGQVTTDDIAVVKEKHDESLSLKK